MKIGDVILTDSGYGVVDSQFDYKFSEPRRNYSNLTCQVLYRLRIIKNRRRGHGYYEYVRPCEILKWQ